MGKKNKNKNKNNSPRPGSVKANRAAGTNKAAQNKAAKGPSPSSSPRSSPRSSPAPARQQAKAAAQMSRKDRRAGAKAAGVSLKDFKQGKTGAKAVARKTAQVNKRNPGLGSPNPSGSKFDKPMMRGGGMYGKDVYNPNSPDYGDYSRPKNYSPGKSKPGSNSFTNAQMAGKGRGGGLGKARRKAQQNSGLSMADYRAGVKGGTLDKHGRPKTGSGMSNQSGGSPWENFSNSFNQDEWNQNVKDNYGKYGGKPTLAGSWGENGFKMDANNPIAIPAFGKYGFKAGDYAFDKDGFTMHKNNMDGRGGAGITGRISYVKKNGEVIPEFDGVSSVNPNWDKYAESGSARMSSEGLYQDKYNVGYHGSDDKGEEYMSSSFYGDIGADFQKYNKGEQSFGEAYNNFAGGNRKNGYAGDILKMVDQGHINVSDDDYNMLVVDTKNYDWDSRMKTSGKDAHGGGSYDPRAGGESQNNVIGNQNFYANRAAGYHQAGAMDPGEAAAKYGKNSQTQTSYEAPNNNSFNYEMPNLGQNMGPQYQGWQEQMGDASKPYASRSKSSGMNFNFNPYKFQQGQ